ncbi:ATP-binding protein [Aliterella atlantica]|uniref:histidine kinase n=1 Tax=Aliterella atlantica CENA595 TaxID=1618023 RepID=A0A0D8ZPC7_9CYAN|nr:ATP-binding protein [Aliterella atlantica]KJH70339.1 hypothetical protein UH38_18720 [Aliterella atlantica CENA595]
MVSSDRQSFSLVEMTSTVESPPQLLPVTPTTLYALFGATVDLLVEQQIRAQLWLKLPPGQIWRSEIERYHVTGLCEGVYGFHVGQNSKLSAAGERSLKLPVSSKLQREYFLLVLSPSFNILVLAHRRHHQRQKIRTGSDLSGSLRANKPSRVEKKDSLISVCSWQPQVVEQVLEGIHQEIIAVTTKNAAKKTNASAQAITQLLANWDELFAIAPSPPLELIECLFTYQIQRQDRLLRRASAGAIARLQQRNQELGNSVGQKDELLGSACQEMRTPLTNMKTALSLLNSPHLKPPQRLRYLQMLHTECDRQNSVINGLLELVQINRTPKHTPLQPVRLSEIVPGVVSTYQPLAQEKGIMLAYTVPEQLPPVLCLNSWLKQIAINLLHNSIKFTPNGGQVWVRARQISDRVMLEFRDTGMGIAERDIPKVFDLFYHTRPTADDSYGAGLGLTVVKELLERCGGSIAVKSKLGEGSTFTVTLATSPVTPQSASS